MVPDALLATTSLLFTLSSAAALLIAQQNKTESDPQDEEDQIRMYLDRGDGEWWPAEEEEGRVGNATTEGGGGAGWNGTTEGNGTAWWPSAPSMSPRPLTPPFSSPLFPASSPPSFSTSKLPQSLDHRQPIERLPDWLDPIQYELGLSLDSDLDFVRGQVQIEFQCRSATSRLLLHLSPDFVSVRHLIVHSKWLNRTVPIESMETDWRRQMIRIGLGEQLVRGHVYYLAIWFSARYAEDGRGLGRQQDTDGVPWLNSLFQPSFARRLLPCFDEPKFRSAFRLELWLWNRWASEDFVALSNTRSQCRRWHANLTMCTFAVTPPIPSYLFTLALGRFRSVCNQSELALLDSDICVWRLASMADQDEQWEGRALEVIDAMAQFQTGMSDYLLADAGGVRLHLLVVPMKVKINGMENLGLLNVRETLWPSPNDSLASMGRLEKTLFHEMTHQWFGNLVTPSWWSCVWLSESVTTFLSSARPIVFDPSSDLSELALISDSWVLNSERSAKAGGTIPKILYTKGAILMEMLDSLIGAQRMQRLLREMVRKFQFGTIDTADFLALLEGTLSRDGSGVGDPPLVVRFLDRWLHLPSHPIVFVDFDPDLGLLCLSQSPKMPSSPVRQRWPVPVWIECVEGSVPEGLYWIPEGDNAQLVLPLQRLTRTNSTRSLAFNRNRSVYYQLTIRISH